MLMTLLLSKQAFFHFTLPHSLTVSTWDFHKVAFTIFRHLFLPHYYLSLLSNTSRVGFGSKWKYKNGAIFKASALFHLPFLHGSHFYAKFCCGVDILWPCIEAQPLSLNPDRSWHLCRDLRFVPVTASVWSRPWGRERKEKFPSCNYTRQHP